MLLDRQPRKVLKEDAVKYKFSYIDKIYILFQFNYEIIENIIFFCRFYAAQVVVALEYLHCQGKSFNIHFQFHRNLECKYY